MYTTKCIRVGSILAVHTVVISRTFHPCHRLYQVNWRTGKTWSYDADNFEDAQACLQMMAWNWLANPGVFAMLNDVALLFNLPGAYHTA